MKKFIFAPLASIFVKSVNWAPTRLTPVLIQILKWYHELNLYSRNKIVANELECQIYDIAKKSELKKVCLYTHNIIFSKNYQKWIWITFFSFWQAFYKNWRYRCKNYLFQILIFLLCQKFDALSPQKKILNLTIEIGKKTHF